MSGSLVAMIKDRAGSDSWLDAVAQPVIGSRANIERFQRDQLVRFVERQYTGANLIVGAAEAVDADEIVRSADVFDMCGHLETLTDLRGRETAQHWQTLAREGRWAEAFADLMHRHDDPPYAMSIERNDAGVASASQVPLREGSQAALCEAAAELLALEAVAPKADSTLAARP